MNITSGGFAVFTLVGLMVYYWLPYRAQNILLLVLSYLFLAFWKIDFALTFAVLTLLNGLLAPHVRKTWILRFAVVVNIAALIYFKYNDFFLPDDAGTLRLLLPVGLSFYVVQVIAYQLDIHRTLIEPERNWVHFALFMAYFPRVTSGPIERARSFLPQLQRHRKLDSQLFAESVTLILIGLVRKAVIADVLSVTLPDAVFQHPTQFAGAELWMWLLVYGLILYNDFAGYTSIIRGVSGLFGISLSENFNTPYFARNFTEFWQRWHITLSSWLRDYIFMPLMRGLLRQKLNSRHPLTVILPPMATMFVSALWHEVSFNMLVWGGLHGGYQVVERCRSVWFPSKPPQFHPLWRQVVGIGLVFLLTLLAWIPFRADMNTTLAYWGRLFSLEQWTGFNVSRPDRVMLVLLLGLALILDVVHARFGEVGYLNLPPLAKAILINAVILAIVLASAAKGENSLPFIYQNF